MKISLKAALSALSLGAMALGSVPALAQSRDWRENREDRREARREYREDVQDARRDYRRDVREARRDWRDDRRHDNGRHKGHWKRPVGSFIAMTGTARIAAMAVDIGPIAIIAAAMSRSA